VTEPAIVERWAARAGRVAYARRSAVLDVVQRGRRQALLAGLRAQAEWAGASLDLSIDRSVTIGRRLRVRITPGSSSTLRIAEGTTIGDDVLILCKGGSIDIGPWCDVRRGVVLNISGRFVAAGWNVLSWATVVHCSNRITLHEKVAVGDYVTLVDSSHFHDATDRTIHENVEFGAIEVGANTLLAAKCTLTRNARIGSHCIVAANSVVTGPVPNWRLVSGVPAAVVKELTPRPPQE
jgi:acetyltransferase-like isoleucine patch superfamily enzyme